MMMTESPFPVDSRLDNERQKSLKKKKSITRMFSLSRHKSSKSRPTSPIPMSPSPTTIQFPPALPPTPTPSAKPSGFVTSPSRPPHTRSKSLGQPHPHILGDLDTDFAKEMETELQNIRSSTSSQHSKLVQNFSRHPRERKASIVSTDSSRNVSPQLGGRSSQDARRTSRSLLPRQSHEALSSIRPPEPFSAIPELPSPHTPVRPQTAHADNVPSYSKEFSPPLPRQGLLIHHGRSHENLKAHKSPVLDQWVAPWSTDAEEEIRTSVRSAVSTWSSGMDSGSTKHSSVFTKMSSVSDATEDTFDLEYGKDTMTVDDAIDLYCAGFEDDPLEGHYGLAESSSWDNSPVDGNSPVEDSPIDPESARLAEEMRESMNTPLAPPRTAHAAHPPTSAAILSGEIFRNIFPRPPELREVTKTHDQYGFRKYSRDVKISQYDAWWSGYSKVQTRRTSRWTSLMKDCGLTTKNPEIFPQRSAKVQRYIRKGLPPAWRGNMWFHYAGGQAFLDRYPDLYNELVVTSSNSQLIQNDKESIERDLHRTFPDNVHFKPESPLEDGKETPLLSALRRVLCAFAVHHPRIGYCQSLNFIAGMLLLFLPEAKAFWMLHIITTRYLPGTHEVSLEGANVDLWVLMLAVEDELPTIWTKINGETQTNSSRLPPISLCTTPWFMSLFIGTLPVESVLRVWDMLFYEGSTTIFRVALAIFRLGEAEIRAVNDPMETFQVVQCLPRKMIDAGAVITTTCRRGSVAQPSWVEKRRRERKEWYAEERQAERARKESMENGGADDADDDDDDEEDDIINITSASAAAKHLETLTDDLPTPKAISVPNGAGTASFGQLAAAARSESDLSRSKSFGRWAKRSMSTSNGRRRV